MTTTGGDGFALWREDDNGQRFLVARFATLDAAERRLAELTRVPHRQSYWICAPPQTAAAGDER